MAKDYAKLCPKLSKHIAQETVAADFAVVDVVDSKAPAMTKGKVEQFYAMMKDGESCSNIVNATGLQRKQIKALFNELNAYKGWTEPVEEEGV
jgi:hypothetical protein